MFDMKNALCNDLIVKLIAHKKGIQLKIQYPDPSQENLSHSLSCNRISTLGGYGLKLIENF
jgi:hypothetical protein